MVYQHARCTEPPGHRAQNDLICPPELISETLLMAVQNGGSARVAPDLSRLPNVNEVLRPYDPIDYDRLTVASPVDDCGVHDSRLWADTSACSPLVKSSRSAPSPARSLPTSRRGARRAAATLAPAACLLPGSSTRCRADGRLRIGRSPALLRESGRSSAA